MGRNAKPKIADDNKVSKISKTVHERRKTAEKNIVGKSRKLECPMFLSKAAKVEWRRIKRIDNSRATPLIYDSDISGLIMLCELWSVFSQAQSEWASTQTVQITVGEKTMVNPCIAEMKRIGAALMPLYAQYGLTPLGRAKIAADTAKASPKDSDSDEDFD